MAAVSIGNHPKILARAADQQRIRSFYRDVLGCIMTKESDDVDFFRFDAGFFVAVLYQDHVASAEELTNSIWLELRTHDPAALSENLLDLRGDRVSAAAVSDAPA